MMVIHLIDPPTEAGALHIIFSKLGLGILIDFYQFCAVGKNLKAQCKKLGQDLLYKGGKGERKGGKERGGK